MSPLGNTRERPVRRALLSSTASDSHTWNLLYMDCLMREHGWSVTNLGACVPISLLRDESRRQPPDIIVISTVNGHGAQDGLELIAALRADTVLADVPVVIGGKIDISEDRQRRDVPVLLDAGFEAVLIGDSAIGEFLGLLERTAAGPRAYSGLGTRYP
jgi:methylaspartate mutase sigma subunit